MQNSIKYPAVWNKPKTKEDCNICMNTFTGMITSNNVTYSNASSYTSPVYTDIIVSGGIVDMNVSEDPVTDDSEMNVDEITEDSRSFDDSETKSYSDSKSDQEYKRDRLIKPWNQATLKDILRNMGLPKDTADYLAWKMK